MYATIISKLAQAGIKAEYEINDYGVGYIRLYLAGQNVPYVGATLQQIFEEMQLTQQQIEMLDISYVR